MTAKLYKTTELQDRLAERLAATECVPGQPSRTFAGKWWGRGNQAERFYFGASAEIYKDGKRVRGSKVWLQFDDPAALEGVRLHATAKKEWQRRTLVDWHSAAVTIAIELADPAEAARLRDELAAARAAGQCIGELVAGEDD